MCIKCQPARKCLNLETLFWVISRSVTNYFHGLSCCFSIILRKRPRYSLCFQICSWPWPIYVDSSDCGWTSPRWCRTSCHCAATWFATCVGCRTEISAWRERGTWRIWCGPPSRNQSKHKSRSTRKALTLPSSTSRVRRWRFGSPVLPRSTWVCGTVLNLILKCSTFSKNAHSLCIRATHAIHAYFICTSC